MRLLPAWPPLFLLLGAGDVFLPRVLLSGSSLHSLHHFYLGISEPIGDLPLFTQLGFLDDQLITRYDSNTMSDQPQVPWMEKVEDARFWEQETRHAREAEFFFQHALLRLQNRYNQSGGLHTWQCLVGCELSKDGNQKGRSMQCGYDGRDFISLDKETFTWIAADAKAQVTKRKWESDLGIAMTWKGYLEKECIESLQRYRDTGKETLLQTESPMVKVTHKVGQDGLEALICRADGFYPKEIDATWRKDGEIWEHETFRGSVTPNSDGTYHTWLQISVDPKDKERYRCHVEHDGLSEPLDLAWEERGASKHMSMVWWISVPIITVGLMLLIRHYLWKRRRLKKMAGKQQHKEETIISFRLKTMGEHDRAPRCLEGYTADEVIMKRWFTSKIPQGPPSPIQTHPKTKIFWELHSL